MTWRWVSEAAALAIHGEQLAEHGGGTGIRDEGLLESALARPRNLAAYSGGAAQLAAAYAFGIARDHPFVDGNKRTAFITAATFLLLNGFDITPSEKDVVETFLRLAAGELTEEQLAAWFSACMVRKDEKTHDR
jgi:death on curing protein